MTLINKKDEIKLRNGWLYAKNTCIGITIFFIYAISAIPTSVALYVASFHIFGYEAISKITSKLPEFMHIFTGVADHKINSRFYFAVACVVMTVILTGYALDKMNQISKKMGENNYKASIFDIEEKQTITYLSGKGTFKDPIYVKLEKEYRGGCIVKSDSGEKIVTLEYAGVTGEDSNDHKYKVIEYQNKSRPKIKILKMKEDFFEKNAIQRKDVSTHSISPTTLQDLVINHRSQKGRG